MHARREFYASTPPPSPVPCPAMLMGRKPWREELEIIDRTMRAISSMSDAEELVEAYWDGIGELLPIEDYLALSRRGVERPFYIITRSSRFTEHPNPWTERHRLPLLSGGLLGEIAYANAPVIIDDLPPRLRADDPAHFYLDGFASLIALPQYDGGEGLNITCMLFPPGIEIAHATIPMMHWQAGLFGRGTTNQVLRNQLAEALEALDAELKVVGNIQRSLLPRELPAIPGFELAAHYQTSARAGGDYYDFFPLDGGRWGLFIADVAGHGTPAAVLMAITHALAHARPGTHAPPAELLRHLNDDLTRTYTHGGTFVTAFYAVLDPAQRTLTYSTAGHNPPRLIRAGQVMSLSENNALPLGIMEETYHQSTMELIEGDLLLFYTDGITEAVSLPSGSASRQFFGVERLDALLLACESTPPAQCISKIRSALATFTANAPPTDDQTLIAIRCGS
jgi:sigma-B regulation protein RsbU (phosphoserine phosphatase)